MNKFDMLLTTVCDLDPAVIEVTEWRASSQVLDSELHIDGYEVFRNDRSAPIPGVAESYYMWNLCIGQ